MTRVPYLIALALVGCTEGSYREATVEVVDTAVKETAPALAPHPEPSNPAPEAMYANQRFKEVKVEKTGEHSYRVHGSAQIFEANFGWVVEDGHNQLESGHAMTEAGAPEWGRFDLTIDVEKARANSNLTLILFETSAKDGSRQYELAIPL
jgi:hypothetical protein